VYLVRFALRNPYTVLAVMLGLCFLGLAVYPRISSDILPDFKQPVVVSFFSYPGLPTVEMENSVTSRVERALTLAGKLERIESRTLPGAAVIKVFFQPGADASSAMNDIVNLEASDMFHLPPGIEWPFTLRSEPANTPVILGAISGEGLSESELYTIGYYAVRNKMGGLRGVQIPHPFGGKFRQMMVYVDPQKLEAYKLSALDVVNALEKSNLVLSGGALRLGDTEYQVYPENTLLTTDDIDNVPVAIRNDRPIFIKDVGYAKDDAAIQYNIVRVNGNRSVYVPLLREPGENTIQVVDRIREGLAREIPNMKLRGEIPEATEITLVSDQSQYIRQAISNLQYEVLLGALLVVIVVLAFLRRILASIAVLIVIPLSLLTGILGFYFTGHTLNLMTLGGLALAVGSVVNAGIVVVENTVRHLDMGKSAMQAASDGAIEVAGPVFAGTVTTLAVFIPVLFLTGMIGYLFAPLSLVAVITIAASYFVGLTIVPNFCATFFKAVKTETQALQNSKPLSFLERSFQSVLSAIIKRAWLSVIILAAITLSSFLLIPQLGSDLFPEVDSGTFEIRMKTTPGTRLENTETLVIEIEDSIRDIIAENELKAIISNIGMPVGKGAGFSTVLSSNSGPDTAFIVVNLENEGRQTSTSDYVQRLRTELNRRFPGEHFLFVTGGIINLALNQGVPAPIDIRISGSRDATREAAELIVREVSQIPGAVDVQIAQALDYPQLDIKVDRTKAAFFGISQRDVAENVSTALGSSLGFKSMIWVDPKSGTDFFMGVQLEDNEMDSLDELRNLPIAVRNSPEPATVPLSSIAEIKRVTIPAEIARVDISRVQNVYVNINDRDLGSVAGDVEALLADMELPAGVTVALRGPVQSMKEGAASLGFGIISAIVLVFLILMAQFRSVIDPFIIMLAVPLGLVGVIWILLLTGTNLNIQSLTGALMLVGIVVNNSILIVEFANTLLQQGKHSPVEAVIEATRIRLRPILITSLVLVASMLPFTYQFTLGNEAMIPLARALVGGLVVSTFMTLFLVPCVYVLIKRPQVVTA
jgi:HAE1 family hydrophobic/amphiphilic exporter-1